MSKTSKSPHDRYWLISFFLTVSIISLIQPGCSCSSSSIGTPSPPSAVTSVSPENDSFNSLVSTNVNALFRDEMDGASIIDAFTLTVNSTPVSAIVSYDPTTKTATLTPLADLTSNTEYRATIASSVKDANGGSPLSTDYIWSFNTSRAMQLVSRNNNGVVSNDISGNSDIDSSGRYIVFESEATNLTSVATTFKRQHVYRKDTVTGEVLLVSSDANGLEADKKSANPAISSNGRYVVFDSTADRLDAVISSNGISQIYLKDMDEGSIDLVSRDVALSPDNSSAGATKAKVSDDGLRIIFQSSYNYQPAIDGGGVTQIYLKNMVDESVQMISRNALNEAGNDTSANADMSTDGQHIVFESSAPNFPATNGVNNIYYVDANAATHSVEQITLSSAAEEADAASNNPSISDDGSMVVFDSIATNLDNLDNNGVRDVFLRYRPLAFTKLASANPSTDESGNDASSNAKISGDANYVTFESLASDLESGLVPGDVLGVQDIFIRDLTTLPLITIVQLNNPESQIEATSDANNPAISTDGRYVSFHTKEKMTLDDTNTLIDVFRVHNSTHP